MATPAKKIRMSRTTPQQFEIYLNELEHNIDFRENKFTADKPDVIKKSWETLTNKLNSSGGPIKDIAGWKKTFADWRSQVRKRARILKNAQTETGKGGPPEKPLTELESKLLYLSGEVVVNGLANIQEIGVSNEENTHETSTAEMEVPVKRPNKENKGKPKSTISTTIEKFSSTKDNELSEMKKINLNLEKIVQQNDTKIWLMKKKLELKYNVTFEDIEVE